MPKLPCPFPGQEPEKKLTKLELINAIKLDIISELEAQFLYENQINSTDCEVTKRILNDILEEEKIHMGQLNTLLEYLDNSYIKSNREGNKEALDQINNKDRDSLYV
jgi:rubrerythrin